MKREDTIILEKETIRKIDRMVRRNTLKKNGNQDLFHEKTEKVKKRYNRSEKHKRPLIEDFLLQEEEDDYE